MNSYLQWKINNPFYGKQVSILSDASSALEGYIPKGYPHCISKDEMLYGQSWFGQVIDFFGASLLVNSSLASSNLYSDTIQHVYMPCVASNVRLQSIKNKYHDPDLILVYHDYFSGFYEDISESRARSMVYDTYTLLLSSLQTLYEKAKILVLLPEEYGNACQKAAVLAMKQAAKDHNVQYIQVHDGIDEKDTIFSQQQRIAQDVIQALDAHAFSFFEDELEAIPAKAKVRETQEKLDIAPLNLHDAPEAAEENYHIVLTSDSGVVFEDEAKDRNLSALLKRYLDFERDEKRKEEEIKIQL
jgi:hypothetical protein